MSAWLRRLPTWIKITLGVFAVLFVFGAIFGKPADTRPQNLLAAPTPTPSAPSTTPTTTPNEDTFTVTSVTDAATVELTSQSGAKQTVHVAEIAVPPATGGCFQAESTGWASSLLVGKQIVLKATKLVLDDGTDYATAALKAGMAKYAIRGATDAALRAAETAASTSKLGLWAPPCNGAIDMPPVPTVNPEPETQVAAPQPNPAPTTKAQPESSGGSAHYANCAAVKRAGAAPLHRGEPGYSRQLDRDGDGVACEK
ncbi:excalibur calcium-binding domain-containing protein [Amycolatopsis sp. cg5]|uniref:excalibur calcium-binding domain-containing protein n=1 Tax=Amycolatopsis sp. cg5 TaxID=3238802 RepID=UPI00352658AA